MTDLCERCSKILAERERVAPKLGRVHQLWIDQYLLKHAMCLEGSLYGTAALTFRVFQDEIPGAMAECGVAGGVHPAAMHYCMRYVGQYRTIWMFDSFEGIPRPTAKDVAPSGKVDDDIRRILGERLVPDGVIEPTGRAAVPLEDVRTYMRESGAEEKDLRFVEGWFQDTRVRTDTGPLALLRMDADTYESTRCCMDNLYERVTPGGYVLAHDYDLPGVHSAIADALGSEPDVNDFVGTGPVPRSVWWRKT